MKCSAADYDTASMALGSEFMSYSCLQGKTVYLIGNDDSTFFFGNDFFDKLSKLFIEVDAFNAVSFRWVFDKSKSSKEQLSARWHDHPDEEVKDVSEQSHAQRSFADSNAAIYVWDSGFAMIESVYRTSESAFRCRLRFSTNEKSAARLFSEFIQDNMVEEKTDPGKRRAFVLVNSPNGINVQSIGFAGKALDEENYSDEVVVGFKRAVADLTKKDPSGRLIILDGPPGTGKTFMVRAFMDAVQQSKFVIVPPVLIKNLGDPSMVMTFIRETASHPDAPLVIVLEDADQCLSKRKSDNMASISAILNLSDGIIGSMLDLRILATTNTPAAEFDEALLRPGRISSHIKVGNLSWEKSKKLVAKLTEQPETDVSVPWGESTGAPLAHVYEYVKKLKQSK